MFIDDLREEDARLSTARVLRLSAFEISQSGEEFAIGPFIQRHYTSALALILQPQPPNDHQFEDCLFPSRIMMLKTLLGNDAVFGGILRDDVGTILQKQCSDSFVDGIQGHVKIAMAQNASLGSLRQALTAALDKFVTMAVATALARMDRNHNLRLLCKGGAETNLWKALSFVRTFSLLQPDPDSNEIEMKSDGCHGFFSCRFPFSYHIIKFLQAAREPATREQEDVPSPNAIAAIHAMAGNLDRRMQAAPSIGDASFAAISTYFAPPSSVQTSPNYSAYLFDFVNIRSPNFATLHAHEIYELYEAVLRCCGALSSPSLIHAAVWANEERLFHIASILNELKRYRQDMLVALQDEITNIGLAQAKVDNIMAVLDERVLICVINRLSKEAATGAFGARKDANGYQVQDVNVVSWIRLVVQLRPHITSLVTRMPKTSDKTPTAAELKLSQKWTRIEMASVACCPCLSVPDIFCFSPPPHTHTPSLSPSVCVCVHVYMRTCPCVSPCATWLTWMVVSRTLPATQALILAEEAIIPTYTILHQTAEAEASSFVTCLTWGHGSRSITCVTVVGIVYWPVT